MMYCDRCNIDFSEGLRYCKWCGQTLVERRRDTSELKTCPTCSAAIQPAWGFCKACGAQLAGQGKPPEAARITNIDAAQTPAISNCPSCSEPVESGSIYCKACGSALYTQPSRSSSSALLCSVCNSFSPLGSRTCRVCGALLIETDLDLSKRSDEAALIDQQKSSTLPDLDDHLPASEHAHRRASSKDLPSEQASDEIESGAHTLVFTDSDSARLAQLGGEQSAGLEGDTSSTPGKATSVLPGVAGSQFEQPAPTSVFNQRRITGPVDSESPEEAQGSESAGESVAAPSSLVTRLELESFPANEPNEASAPPGTSVLGSNADFRDTGTQFSPHATVSLGSGSAVDEDDRAAAQMSEERPVVRGNIMTAPFGMASPPAVEEGLEGNTQIISEMPQGVNAMQAQEAVMAGLAAEPTLRTNKEIQVIESDNADQIVQPVPEKKGSRSALISIGALVLVAIAAFAAWWLISGSGKSAPPEPSVSTSAPATQPAPPAAPETRPAKPPVPAAPEGMVMVAAGTYIIGRDDADPLEKPRRTVSLPPFFIDRTEVTNADYKRFVDATRHEPPPNWKDGNYPEGKDNYPVTGVTWQDAADYATWAGKRLPTEAEWEAAARGSDGRLYPWGSEWRAALGNIGLKAKDVKASEYASEIKRVGQFSEGASPVGALDMIGNVWEWTADKFALYEGGITEVPSHIKIDPDKVYRVIRGGAYDGSKIHDASYRGLLDASQPYPKVGFRCVKDATSSRQ